MLPLMDTDGLLQLNRFHHFGQCAYPITLLCFYWIFAMPCVFDRSYPTVHLLIRYVPVIHQGLLEEAR